MEALKRSGLTSRYSSITQLRAKKVTKRATERGKEESHGSTRPPTTTSLPNVRQTISNHNKQLLETKTKETTTENKFCNCRQKETCPLKGKCSTKCVVYKATVTEIETNRQETYIGLTDNEFKTRFSLHKSSFKLEQKR